MAAVLGFQYSKTNVMYFYSFNYELRACTCFEHYSLICSSTPNLVAASRYNMHAIYQLFMQRFLNMSK
jgi:hypothetical protein